MTKVVFENQLNKEYRKKSQTEYTDIRMRHENMNNKRRGTKTTKLEAIKLQ